jgi:hypothetical protein
MDIAVPRDDRGACAVCVTILLRIVWGRLGRWISQKDFYLKISGRVRIPLLPQSYSILKCSVDAGRVWSVDLLGLGLGSTSDSHFAKKEPVNILWRLLHCLLVNEVTGIENSKLGQHFEQFEV